MDIGRINELVNFLRANAPHRLEGLRQQFPNNSDVLVVDKMGVSDPAARLRGGIALAVAEELPAKTVSLLATALAQLRSAERHEDLATAITAIGAFATAIVSAWKVAIFPWSMVPAVVTLAGAIWTLVAKRKRRTHFTSDIQTVAVTLSDAADRAKVIASDLRVYLTVDSNIDYSEKILQLVDRANTLAGEVVRTQISLGQFPPNAMA